jgi:hypothetical protein
MEADWEVEIGNDAPVIDANWPGLVKICDEPERVTEIVETEMLPGLAAALLRLNSLRSPVWTCKTDVFVPEHIDPDELAASADESQFGIACYIDLLWRGDQVWDSVFMAERDCRKLCDRMHQIPLLCSRIDLVVRQARIENGNSLGITMYCTACGRTSSDARERLAECLAIFTQLMAPES